MHVDIAAVLGCAFLLAIAGLSVYTASVVRRVQREMTAAELRQLAEVRRAAAENRAETTLARDAAALARADVDGLRREVDDALSEVAGRLSQAGMDVITGVDEDDLITDPRLPSLGERSGVVLAFPGRSQ